MLLDRYQLLQLLDYAREPESAPAEALRVFLQVLYDEASPDARARFIGLVDQTSWPQGAVKPSTLEPALELVRGAPPLRRGPLALILLAGKDADDPTLWLDPASFVADPGDTDFESSRPIWDALMSWDTARLRVLVAAPQTSDTTQRDAKTDSVEPPTTIATVDEKRDPWLKRHLAEVAVGVVVSTVLTGAISVLIDSLRRRNARAGEADARA